MNIQPETTLNYKVSTSTIDKNYENLGNLTDEFVFLTAFLDLPGGYVYLGDLRSPKPKKSTQKRPALEGEKKEQQGNKTRKKLENTTKAILILRKIRKSW